MVALKVWLAGEGPSEIGNRDTSGERVGVLEALLLRIEPTGWVVDRASIWKTDDMSRPRCDRELADRALLADEPAVEAFVAIVERADLGALPNGCDSLTNWLDRARTVLPPAIHGSLPGALPDRP